MNSDIGYYGPSGMTGAHWSSTTSSSGGAMMVSNSTLAGFDFLSANYSVRIVRSF